MKVNFLIAGTQKGGTTALDSYLREHPEICMADVKEVHFFDNESLFPDPGGGGGPDYSKYHASFSPEPSHKLVGETTPIYMYWREAPRRIWEYNPQMKLICILRNPIKRAYSHWNMERSRKSDNLQFLDALHKEALRCKEALPYQHRVYSYADRGFYIEQLRRLWHYFSKKNVLVLKNEYLRNQPLDCLNEIVEFLGVSSYDKIKVRNVHSHTYLTKISDEEKNFLRVLYEHEIQELERLLGWNTEWLYS